MGMPATWSAWTRSAESLLLSANTASPLRANVRYSTTNAKRCFGVSSRTLSARTPTPKSLRCSCCKNRCNPCSRGWLEKWKKSTWHLKNGSVCLALIMRPWTLLTWLTSTATITSLGSTWIKSSQLSSWMKKKYYRPTSQSISVKRLSNL